MAKNRTLFPARQRRRQPKIEIIPMVDVMFLLLVFYILSSLALHKQNGIPVSLPAVSTGDPSDVAQDFVITISSTGEYHLNRDVVPAGQFDNMLKAWASKADLKKVSVIINADRAAQHHYVIDAMDGLRKLGIGNFTISTEPIKGGK